MTSANGKTCKTCGEFKPFDEFYKNKSISDGHGSSCKLCKREYQRKWRKKNRKIHRAYSRRYYRNHTDERAEYYARWREENSESKAEYDRQWRKDNPERMRQRRKIENARRRARLEDAEGDYTVDEWLELKAEYDNTCLACGESEPGVKITPDHVIPLALGGGNSIDNIQPLCWSCNAAKQATIADYRKSWNSK